MSSRLSVVSAHFASFEWTQCLVSRLLEFTPAERLGEIILINQDRTEASAQRLAALSPLVKVVQYPRSERHFEAVFHDHAAVLNQAILEAAGDLIVIFDSDAHPYTPDWLPRCEALLTQYDALLASTTDNLTHPCFMVLQRQHLALELKFDEALFDEGVDTGRLIGRQLETAGERVLRLPPSPAFGGLCGMTHLDCIYHHGQGNFSGNPHPYVQLMVVWQQAWFQHIVVDLHRYQLTKLELAEFFLRYFFHTALPRLRHWQTPYLARSIHRLNILMRRYIKARFHPPKAP
jgi:hypothetical protein